MAKLMNDLQQATPRATLSDDQNDSFKQISPQSKMRNRLGAKGKRLIKTRCNQLSMRSMELWTVAHSNKLIKSNWTRTSMRFSPLSSSASSFYSEQIHPEQKTRVGELGDGGPACLTGNEGWVPHSSPLLA
jgi:hypothetical protein